MRHLIIMVAFVLCATLTVDAQTTFTEAKGSASSNSESTSLVTADSTYTVYVSSTGSHKIERISKSGNTYWMYLGYPTEYLHNGLVVYVNKDGDKYKYYKVGKTGYPLAVALSKE